MKRLHTFGCSITQGFALPDVVKPVCNDEGEPLTHKEMEALGDNFNWNNVHLYQPSEYAWPKILADKLDVPVINHARRGACFNQISRQCAVGSKDIKPGDIVIVMWTYLSRLSLQWPARTTVPFCNVPDPKSNWQTIIIGFNKFFGLSPSDNNTDDTDEHIRNWIHDSVRHTYLDYLSVYDRYYNSLVLQQMTDGFLKATGANVLHLSVEIDSVEQQLEQVRQELPESLKDPYSIPDPTEWYSVEVDYSCTPVIFDSKIPLADNDMHPSVKHHKKFADYVYNHYFEN